MTEVRCSRVAARRVRDDTAPTPLMEGVSIKPVAGTPFLFDVFPDRGCLSEPNDVGPGFCLWNSLGTRVN